MHGDGDSVAVDIGVDCHKLISWVGLRRSGGRDTLGSGSVEERRMICFLLNDYCEVVFSDFVHVKNKFFFSYGRLRGYELRKACCDAIR